MFTVILLGLNIGQVRLHKFLYIQLGYYWGEVSQDSNWKCILSGNHGIRRDKAHIMERYLRGLQFNSIGQYSLPRMKIPYTIDFNTGLPIKP